MVAQTPLEEATRKLDAPDAIMETDVNETINAFVINGGDPAQIIVKLLVGYQGYAAMAGLVAEWTAEFGGGSTGGGGGSHSGNGSGTSAAAPEDAAVSSL